MDGHLVAALNRVVIKSDKRQYEGMKLSMSLPDDDVAFLDDYAVSNGYASRSAVVHAAIRMLKATRLGDAYEGAWDEWAASDDAALWEQTVGDGLAGG